MKLLSEGESRVVKDAFEAALDRLPPAPEWEDIQTVRVTSRPGRRPRLRPMVAVGVTAAAVLVLVGGIAWLLRGEEADSPPADPAEPQLIPTVDSSRKWVSPIDGIELHLDSYQLPERPGRHEIDIIGGFAAPNRIWQCPGLHGRLEPPAGVNVGDVCTEIGPIPATGINRAWFVTLDEDVIDDGGLVVAVTGEAGSWAGTVLIDVVARDPGSVATSIGRISWQSARVDRELTDLHHFEDAFVAREFTGNGSETQIVTSLDGLSWSSLRHQPPGHGWLYEHDGALWTWSQELVSGPFGDVPAIFRLDSLDGEWLPVAVAPGGRIHSIEMTFVAGPAGALVVGARDDGAAVLWVLGDEDGFDRFDVVFDPVIASLPMPRADATQTDDGYAGLIVGLDFLPTDDGFLAYYSVGDEPGVEKLHWLHSPDGRVWSHIEAPLEFARFLPWASIAEHEGRMLAVGEGVRRSDDGGLTWTEVETSPADIAGTDFIAAGPSGWMMPAGQAGIIWESADLMVSTDGVVWDVAYPDVPAVTGMLVTEDHLIVSTMSGGWSDAPLFQVWVGMVTP